MDNINTTKSMKKASTQLEGKIQKTRDNMDALLAQAGCKGAKKVKTRIPLSLVTPNDDVLYLGLNGVGFYFRRGETVELAEPLVELMENCKEL